MKIKYNDNVTIVSEDVTISEAKDLRSDEWIALMVTDMVTSTDSRVFFSPSKGWLGLERTRDEIYISKAENRNSYPFGAMAKGRGIAMRVVVLDPSLCCVLTT